MGRTIAEMYIDQGRTIGLAEGKKKGAIEGSRAILLRLLRRRFKKVPRRVVAHVTAATSMRDLETWLDNFANAAMLDDVGIPLDQ